MLFDTGIVIITLFTALAMATGLAGCVLPVIPGPSLIWLGGLVYGLLTGFGFVGWTAMALMTVLLVVGSAAPYVLPHLTGRKTGASRRALLAGVVLGIVGFFVLPIVGALIGAILGVFATEWAIRRNPRSAWTATKGVVVGWGLGAFIQGTAGVLMTVAWIVWAIFTLTRPLA